VLIHESDELTVHAVHAGRLWLDGGAMFGVVPKPLWSRKIEADDRNRIPLATRCLLVEAGGRRMLVDSGVGTKEDEKFEDIYGVEAGPPPGSDADSRLEASLAEIGVAPEDVDLVLSTHLHFDHAGGNTVVAEGDGGEGDGAEIRPAFPNATYLIRRGEWEFAHRDNERIQASYLKHNFDPLRRAGVVELLDGDEEVLPGVRTRRTAGHTPHHQSVIFEDGETTLCYLADLVPTSAHVRLPWIMGYDVEPLVTLESKRELLTRAAEERWTLIFEHDPEVAAGRAVPSGSERGGCELTDRRPHPAGAEESDEQ